jgi:hypothetical protein
VRSKAERAVEDSTIAVGEVVSILVTEGDGVEAGELVDLPDRNRHTSERGQCKNRFRAPYRQLGPVVDKKKCRENVSKGIRLVRFS